MTKIQAIVVTAIVIVAAVGGVLIYVLFGGEEHSDSIKIGVCADLDNFFGKSIWQEVVLAVEHINAEGGVLGRRFEVVSEDDDSESATMDTAVATNAITRLITVDKADYIITSGFAFSSIYQEIAYQHKKIMFDGLSWNEELTQKVLDNYDRYKYYFRVGLPNATSVYEGTLDEIVTCREYTGFSKVAFVGEDIEGAEATFSALAASLQGFDMDVVYTARVPFDTVDFSSYFAQAEAAGAEILYATGLGPTCIPFVKEYYDRQSPMVLWGSITMAQQSDFWELTEGKCEFVSANMYPTVVGYPLTNRTLIFREACIERWGEIGIAGGALYDAVRYILSDAIIRAGTFETDAVIAALETVDVETSLARHFVFTSSHDIMIGEAGPNRPSEDYFLVCAFQWQSSERVLVYPKEIMEEVEASYKYPDWPGPWD